MIGHSVVRRYLAAALEAADREDLRERLGAQLGRLTPLATAGPDLERLLAHPTMPVARKLEAVGRLLGEPPVAPLRDLIVLLIDNDRVEVLRGAAQVYQELVDEADGVVRAHVITALPLPEDQAQRLSGALGRWLGAPVVLDRRVDPGTIGGLAVRVGDRTLDASLRGRLDRLRAQMTSEGRSASSPASPAAHTGE